MRHAEIEAVRGDLLTQGDVDVIVNAANTHLEHMGGLAGAVSHAGGYPKERPTGRDAVGWVPTSLIQKESRRLRPVPTGSAVSTTAGELPFKAVVHAVGPIWGGGDYEEERLLRLAHVSACAEAVRAGATRVAFPAISCGIFGFPVRRAAPIAVDAAREAVVALPDLELVRFVLADEGHLEAFRAALASDPSERSAVPPLGAA